MCVCVISDSDGTAAMLVCMLVAWVGTATGLGCESDAGDVCVAVLCVVCGVMGLSEMRKCLAWGGVGCVGGE